MGVFEHFSMNATYTMEAACTKEYNILLISDPRLWGNTGSKQDGYHLNGSGQYLPMYKLAIENASSLARSVLSRVCGNSRAIKSTNLSSDVRSVEACSQFLLLFRTDRQ